LLRVIFSSASYFYFMSVRGVAAFMILIDVVVALTLWLC